MGCASGFGRVVLVILNLLFLIVSLALIAVGVVLKFYADKILSLVGDYAGAADSTLDSLAIPKLSEITSIPFLDEIGIAFLVFGIVLFLIAFCACCGACCAFRPLLIVFAVTMIVLVLAQAVVGGLLLTKDSALHKGIKDKIGEQITNKYEDSKDTKDVFSLAINIMNYMLQCCGISGYKDFKNDLPALSCCKKDVMTNNPGTCASPAVSNDFNQQGCYDKLQDKILANKTLAAVILGLIILLQVVEVVFAVIIVREASQVGIV